MRFPALLPTVLLSLAALPLAAQDTPAPPPAAKPFTAEEEARYLERGKQVMAWFHAGHADSIAAAMEASAAAQLTRERVVELMDVYAERAGTPTKVLVEKMTRRNGVPQFWWEAEVVNFTDEPVVMRWLFNEQLQIVGVGFTPKSRAPFDP